MTTLKITLPASIEFAKRNGATVTVDPSKLHESILADLFTYGLRQKVFDSASGNPEKAESTTAMTQCIEKLNSGDWTIRNAAAASDPLDSYRIQVVRKLMASGNSDKVRAAYEAIPSDEQAARRAFILSVAEKNAKAIDPVATKMKAEADAKATALASLNIAI